MNDTQPILVGDVIFFKSPSANAIQTVTSKDATHIYFANDANDWFHFNQPNAPVRPLAIMKGTVSTTSAWLSTSPVTLFRALMITYYVDNTTTPGTPRLTRVVNHFTPQALAGVVEDLDLTYDLVDGVTNPTAITSLPYTDVVAGVTYNSNQIRKVNIHVGVRDGRFRAIQLRISGGTIDFQRVVVHYGNGSQEELIFRERIPSGGRTRPMDLPGERRVIESVELWYSKESWHRRPKVDLYGLR